MGIVTRTITILFAAGGLSVFSQAPEFAQQYRQRLGGAIDELRTVVQEFDADAAASNLTRGQALQKMLDSAEQFFHDRGITMDRTIGRFESLVRQQELMERSHPVTRPLFVLQSPDRKVIEGVWSQFEPAVPLNVPGVVYGGLGALILAAMAQMGIASAREVARRRRTMRKGIGKGAEAGELAPAGAAAGSGAPASPHRPAAWPAPGSGPLPQHYPESLSPAANLARRGPEPLPAVAAPPLDGVEDGPKGRG